VGGQARAALDRIELPQDIVDRISEIITPGSSLIISDEGMSTDTGEETRQSAANQSAGQIPC
jgi:hypothetical protein